MCPAHCGHRQVPSTCCATPLIILCILRYHRAAERRRIMSLRLLLVVKDVVCREGIDIELGGVEVRFSVLG